MLRRSEKRHANDDAFRVAVNTGCACIVFRDVNPHPCIYCGNPADSREHPLIAALGEFENAPMLDDRICRRCNTERLGILDEQYVRCGPEGFLRRHYGIEGRSGAGGVNPFYRGSAGGRAIKMLAYDEAMGLEVLIEGENGNYRQARQLIFVERSGNAHHLPIRDGMTADQLRDEVKRLNLSEGPDVHMVAGPDEWEFVAQLVRSAWPKVVVGDGAPMSERYNGATATVTLTDRYFRAVAKIGFHYFLTQFPEFRGDEAIFDDIRRFITEEGQKVDAANKVVKKRNHALIVEMLPANTRPAGWRAHVLAAEIKNGQLLAHVQTFVTEDWPAPTYTVLLGAARPEIANRAAGHIYMYFQDGRHGKYSGEALDLTPASLNISVPPATPVVLS